MLGDSMKSNFHQLELFFSGYKFLNGGTPVPSSKIRATLNGNPLGTTEPIGNKKNPKFRDPAIVHYIFEKKQLINLEILDGADNKLGEGKFVLGALIGSETKSIEVPVQGQGLDENAYVKVMFEGVPSESLRLQNSAPPLIERASFSEHIKGGLNITAMICVDFTVSNGAINSPHGLHKICSGPDELNDYQKAIRSVLEILLDYDKDKQVHMYGFGAKPRFPKLNESRASHFFPCTGDYKNTSAETIPQAFEIYDICRRNVEMSGPTFFEPLLEKAVGLARDGFDQDPKNYIILMILTDGVIHDIQESIDQLVEGSDTPLSVIIVGVGKENFKLMHQLDSDEHKLVNEDGKQAERDICQFVNFNEFHDKPIGDFAEAVLEELPHQVVSFMDMKHISPSKLMDDVIRDNQSSPSQIQYPSGGSNFNFNNQNVNPAQGNSQNNVDFNYSSSMNQKQNQSFGGGAGGPGGQDPGPSQWNLKQGSGISQNQNQRVNVNVAGNQGPGQFNQGFNNNNYNNSYNNGGQQSGEPSMIFRQSTPNQANVNPNNGSNMFGGNQNNGGAGQPLPNAQPGSFVYPSQNPMNSYPAHPNAMNKQKTIQSQGGGGGIQPSFHYNQPGTGQSNHPSFGNRQNSGGPGQPYQQPQNQSGVNNQRGFPAANSQNPQQSQAQTLDPSSLQPNQPLFDSMTTGARPPQHRSHHY